MVRIGPNDEGVMRSVQMVSTMNRDGVDWRLIMVDADRLLV